MNASIGTIKGLLLARAIVCFLILSPTIPCRAQDSSSQEIVEERITASDREHWSFAPLKRPDLPEVQDSAWCSSPVDYFVLAQLEEHRLSPSPVSPADRLLRRLSFDLLGLPPNTQEAKRFVQASSKSEEVYAQKVDQFLNDPAFGERWAQFWLDLARFAETDGFEHDKVRKGVWRYRDWVVDSLNRSLPYRDFVQLQLAGDLLTENHAVATAFCTAGPDMPDINEQDLRRFDKLNEITGTVGSALLGLQMQCAQCHDHKYDPISQADFYRLRAVFSSSLPVMKRDKHVIELSEQADTPQPRLHFRGELGKPGPVVEAGFPRILVDPELPARCLTNQPRIEFANWLFSSDNPITARVIANRVWQHHFSRSLPENPSDFGIIAGEPTHPKLLDWLACELMDSNWDMKHLHRTILLSSTYRQAGVAMQSKSESKEISTLRSELYGVFPQRRLEGEAIRDAMLACSGLLARQVGGESVMPSLPPEMTSTLLRGQWKASSRDEDHYRRSIYIFARRNLRYPMFDVFDRPDAGASCARRAKSTTALQSLQMMNSPFTFTCAEAMCKLLAHEGRSADAVVSDMFWSCYGRAPSSSETRLLADYIRSSSNTEEGVLECVVAVFNSNEFLYID